MFASAAIARMVARSYPDSANRCLAAARITAFVSADDRRMPTSVGQQVLTSCHGRRLLIPVDFSMLPTEFPYSLMVPQATTERLLLDRLTELGGAVLRPKTLASVRQDTDGVTATFDDGDTIRARYVVGADGIHSTVREQAGIGFEGGAYQESFTLADVRLRGDAPADEVVLFWAKAGLTVVAPLPGNIFRI